VLFGGPLGHRASQSGSFGVAADNPYVNEKTILVIGPVPPPSTGMELATQALLAELARADIRFARVDTADPADTLGNRGKWTVHNISLALRHVLGAARAILRRETCAVYVPIAQEFPGLVRDIAFLLVARVGRVPTIVHLHGGAFREFYASRSKPAQWLVRKTVGGAALGIVLTENLRPALECVIPTERVSVVPNGIDMTNAPDRHRSNETVRILFLSSLIRWKGPLVFIDAFARAHRRCPFLRATLAGDWASAEIRVEAVRLASDLGVAEHLEFPGAVDDEKKRALFHAADIFCFASLVPEGQPLVILEAMGAGLPVVAPAWPGIADTVVDGQSALLVAPNSPNALAERLVELAEDPEKRLRLGAAGRRRYEQLFTQRAFGDRMIEVLRPFLERPSRALTWGAG
jgi:glycosyltransferase involved in cell wall biosynthesis